MGRLIILAVLIVTIPRWSGAFMPIDKFVLFGLPVTAIGTGIIMGLGTYYVVETLQMVNRQYREKFAKWETHDKNMQAQGKVNRKPKPHPPRSRIWLALFFGLLLFLTAVSQTPYVISEFTGTPVQELMTVRWLAAYSLALVLSPEIIVAASALAVHERGALKDDKLKKDDTGKASLWQLCYQLVSKKLGAAGDSEGEAEGEKEEAPLKTPLVCFCGWDETTSPRGLSSHTRQHKKEALQFDTPTLAYKHFVEAYPHGYNGDGDESVEEYDAPAPDRKTLERWFRDK
jgi:hypothetical protein